MAKARDVPGLDPDVAFAQAAARAVGVRAEEVFEHAEGVLDTSDIERVHAMRVATRRLRAVLEIFAPCFPPDRFKPALRDVKALADALGERRDPDVQLDAIAKLEDAMARRDKPGLEVFAARLREEQAAGNAAVAAALEDIERTDLRGRLMALAAVAEPATGGGAVEAAA